MRPVPLEVMRGLRAICDEFGLLLAFDEVQTGVGRSGRMWAHQWSGIAPDVISAAKGIGGGFPLGAILASEAVARHLVPGTHGTTYGGGPLACAAGLAVLDVVLAPGFLDGVDGTARHFWRGLGGLVARHPAVLAGVQGAGLLVGLQLRDHVRNGDLQAAAMARGLLTLTAGRNVLRIAPPLIVTRDDCDEALHLLEHALGDVDVARTTAAA